MKASEKFTRDIILKIRETIKDACGNEVMFCGCVNSEGLIDSVIVAARGNEDSVPALEAFTEKGDVVIHNHPNSNLKPSSADLGIASILGSQGIGFYIIDNEAENVYAAAEPLLQRKKKLLDPQQLGSVLSIGGRLSEIYEFFEARESQINMLEFVCTAFNSETALIAEAGTGVGKSLAYLLPSFKWVNDNEDRVVISTATINLQHQLMEKDIPLVKKLLKTDKKSALVKGRSNYLCFQKYYDKLNENSLFQQEDKNLEILRKWADITETGDKTDLPVMAAGSLWSEICSEADYCFGLYCEHREKCFVIRARKNAASASVLVVNHHILFSDLTARSSGAGFSGTAILPAFKRIVFDEAHNIEDAATSFFSMILNRSFLAKTLKKIYYVNKGKVTGLIRFLESVFELKDEKFRELPGIISDIYSDYTNLEKEAETVLGEKQNITLENTEETVNLYRLFELLKQRINKIYLIFDDYFHKLEISPEDDPRVYEIVLIRNRLLNFINTCSMLINTENDYVSWIEKGRIISFNVTPVDVSRMLKETLYDKIKTIVFTSATLSINYDFKYWKKRIGLDLADNEIAEQFFKSPFDYKNQVLLGIPSNLSFPSTDEYSSELSEFIYDILLIADGGALILFTSYSMLLSVYEKIQERIISHGITLYKQGDFDRFHLLNMFNKDSRSVLLATDSFWEGIDSPGETLKLLIICRLPFRVPSDPVTRARMEKIEKQGKSSFMYYSLPEAVLKLKQGFGRLMRRNTDRGVVIITDTRITNKAYGKIFISSLPETRYFSGDKTELYRKVEDFYY